MNVIRNTVLAIIAQFGLSSAVLADISVCNDFRVRVRVALASENGGAFPAAGWWAVDPKACRDVDFPFQGAVLYYTADSDPYREAIAEVQRLPAEDQEQIGRTLLSCREAARITRGNR